MRKLKWIAPVVMVGVLSVVVFAQKAQAGIAAVVCATGDAMPQGDTLQLVYIAQSTPSRILPEILAKAEAMRQCSSEGCSRCEHVCSGEGTLFMAIAHKTSGERWVVGCSLEQVSRRTDAQALIQEIGPRATAIAADRCDLRLRELNSPYSCNRTRPKFIYHQEPQDLPFVGHVY